jgi:peptidoglycan-N-acetylglucosamine deacetylase
MLLLPPKYTILYNTTNYGNLIILERFDYFMKKLLLILSLLIILLGSFFISYRPHPSIKVSESKISKDIENNKKSTAEEPIAKEPVINNEPVKKVPVFYDILGSSTRPKIYPDVAMIKWRSDVVKLAKKYPSDLYINGQDQDKIVALTFDDGPDPVNTPKIIKVLRDNNIQGTFFCIGRQIEACKSIIKQAYADGDVIASHSWSHKDFTSISVASINNEVVLTENEINKVIGKKPALIRPPYGAINDVTLTSLNSLNYKSILWSIDTLDWEQREVGNIVKNVVENVRPGEIILMHCDGDKQVTTEALPQIILKLKKMGYSFVTLDRLLSIPAYK